ncbi:conserved hypothetical protein [Neospora caninum Liverpool]|uniref:tRNA(Phe) 7-[(3-amino-3-carboxypropyl)-4-demethylwyosine(37)-N(4)]-methyltransferase n=1 Tax=Neospora caninum (strain Liverpool) TaxID=572307 RepID=F0VLL6_NEOCL|nr:conserved hypothetical protein [Neospora caninum Liverpool]CBZ54144.1 conserved hypothetical protein [Neospora caninum Liverpool]CEL68844.1 TPA: hypothetical protein BN1204_045760 [Neospora caninum Liverpool]|eukprot:XP_003884175.1 conserved hypothetical protein [Neospora caninum Liverpool]
MAARPSSRLLPKVSFLFSPSRLSSPSSSSHSTLSPPPLSRSVSASPCSPSSALPSTPLSSHGGASLSRNPPLTCRSSLPPSSPSPPSSSPPSSSSPSHYPPSSASPFSSSSLTRRRARTSPQPPWVSSFAPQDAFSEIKTIFDERKEAALAAITPAAASETLALPSASEQDLVTSFLLPPSSFRAPRSRPSQRNPQSNPPKLVQPGIECAEPRRPCSGAEHNSAEEATPRHRRDKSKKGSVDEEIRPLLDAVNSLKNFYTASSCAGRVLLVGTPFPNSSSLSPSGSASLCDSTSASSRVSSPSRSASSFFEQPSAGPAASSGFAFLAEQSEATQGEGGGEEANTLVRPESGEASRALEGARPGEEGRRKKHSFVFLLNHHQHVDAKQLLHAIAACPIPCQEIWLKVEAPILHVCCRSLTDALNLIRVARPYTYRAVLLHASSSSSRSALGAPSSCVDGSRSGGESKLLSVSAEEEASKERAREEEESAVAVRGEAGREQARGLRGVSGAPLHRKDKTRTAEERGRDNARYIVELSNSSRLAVPILVESAWLFPLPRAFLPAGETPAARRYERGTDAFSPLEKHTPDRATECEGERTAREGKRATANAGPPRTPERPPPAVRTQAATAECEVEGDSEGSETGNARTGRKEEGENRLNEGQSKFEGRTEGVRREEWNEEDTHRWDRWGALARVCNTALEESRTRFFKLEQHLLELTKKHQS